MNCIGSPDAPSSPYPASGYVASDPPPPGVTACPATVSAPPTASAPPTVAAPSTCNVPSNCALPWLSIDATSVPGSSPETTETGFTGLRQNPVVDDVHLRRGQRRAHED